MTLNPLDFRYPLTSLIAAGAVVATTCLFTANSVDAAALQVTPLYSAPAEVAPQTPAAATQQVPAEPAPANSMSPKLAYDFQIEKFFLTLFCSQSNQKEKQEMTYSLEKNSLMMTLYQLDDPLNILMV